MSLEIALQETTVAIRDLIAQLKASNTSGPVTKSPDLDAAADKIEAEAKLTAKLNAEDAQLKAAIRESNVEAAIAASKVEIPKPATSPAAVATAATATAAAAAESPSEQPAIDYAKDVKPLLLKVSTSKGRDALVALLAQFGVVKGDALPADKLGNVIAEVELLLAA